MMELQRTFDLARWSLGLDELEPYINFDELCGRLYNEAYFEVV